MRRRAVFPVRDHSSNSGFLPLGVLGGFARNLDVDQRNVGALAEFNDRFPSFNERTAGLDAASLWNSQAAIVELQQRVIRRATRVVVLPDHSKVGRSADHFLSALNESPPAALLAPAAPTELPVHFL